VKAAAWFSFLPPGTSRRGRPPAYSFTQRHRAQEALQAIKRADPQHQDHYLRLYAAAVAGATRAPDLAETLFRHTAIALEISIDALSW